MHLKNSLLAVATVVSSLAASESQIFLAENDTLISINYQGENIRKVATATPFFLSPEASENSAELFWFDPIQKSLISINTDSLEQTPKVIAFPQAPWALSYDETQGLFFYNNSTDKCVASYDPSTGESTLYPFTSYEGSFLSFTIIDDEEQILYWGNSNALYRSKLDGTEQVEQLFTTEYGIADFCIDKKNQKLYIAHNPLNEILSYDLSNGYITPLVPGDTAEYMCDIEFDQYNNSLFWTTTTGIKSCSVDNPVVETIIDGLPNMYGRELELSPKKTEVELTTVEKCLAFTDSSLWTASKDDLIPDSELTIDGNGSLYTTADGSFNIHSMKLNTVELNSDADTLDLSFYMTGKSSKWWAGSISVVITAPSAGIWHANLGTIPLSSVEEKKWNELSLPLPQSVKRVLSGEYEDLQININFQVPTSSVAYHFDSIRFK